MTSDGFLVDVFLPELGLGAGVALWSFRACARGGAKCCAIVRGFQETFGDRGPKALDQVIALTKTLGTDGGRYIKLAMPGCARVTADELSIVAVLSSAQARDRALCDAHLSWLLAGPPPQALSDTAHEIADHFSMSGLQIIAPNLEIKTQRPPSRRLAVVPGHA